MKKIFSFLFLALLTTGAFAQTKKTTSAIVRFDASTSLDKLPKAENKTVIAELDTKTGTIGFEAAVKNFAFSNPTMQQHFNSATWLNSSVYPLFTFTGKITDLSKVDFTKNGTYTVSVTGDLVVKDVTKSITTNATIIVTDGTLTVSAEFAVKLADFGITSSFIDGGKVDNDTEIAISAELK